MKKPSFSLSYSQKPASALYVVNLAWSRDHNRALNLWASGSSGLIGGLCRQKSICELFEANKHCLEYGHLSMG